MTMACSTCSSLLLRWQGPSAQSGLLAWGTAADTSPLEREGGREKKLALVRHAVAVCRPARRIRSDPVSSCTWTDGPDSDKAVAVMLSVEYLEGQGTECLGGTYSVKAVLSGALSLRGHNEGESISSLS
jgi:hypothetical protein